MSMRGDAGDAARVSRPTLMPSLSRYDDVPFGHSTPTMYASSHSDGDSILPNGDITSHLTRKKSTRDSGTCAWFEEAGEGDSRLIDTPLETHRRTMLSPNVDGTSLVQRGINVASTIIIFAVRLGPCHDTVPGKE
jgi:hypothetical protein